MHLYVVVCDPAGNPLTILAVPFNTLRLLSDTTLILEPGDHPFIKHRTSVSFDSLRTFEINNLSQLEALCAAGESTSFERRSAVSPDLLTRIIKGALQSDLTPKGMVRQLKERLGINSVEDL